MPKATVSPASTEAMASPFIALIAGALAGLMMAGCTLSETPDPGQIEVMRPRPASFADPTLMKPGPEGSYLLYHQDLAAESSRYGSIIIEPVTLWCGDMTLDIAPEDQTILSVYMYQVLKQHLGHDFTIVDRPGPGVMRLRIAVIDFGRAPTGMHTVSSMPPPAALFDVVKQISPGAYSFTGAAESEGEVTDSLTGARLLTWVDRRIGGGSRKTPAQWQWSDAHAAIDYWAETLSARLVQWHYQGDVAG